MKYLFEMPCALSQNTNIYKEEYCLNLHKQQTKVHKNKNGREINPFRFHSYIFP